MSGYRHAIIIGASRAGRLEGSIHRQYLITAVLLANQ